MSQVSALGEAHSEHRVAGIQKRKINCKICLRARMGLHIDVFRAKKFFCSVSGDILHNINALTAAVISFSGIALGIFIRQNRTHCLQNGFRNDILGCDKFNVVTLPVKFLLHCLSDLGVVIAKIINIFHLYTLLRSYF